MESLNLMIDLCTLHWFYQYGVHLGYQFPHERLE